MPPRICACIARNVMCLPGGAFHRDDADLASLRLWFAAPGIAGIETGVERLAMALREFGRG